MEGEKRLSTAQEEKEREKGRERKRLMRDPKSVVPLYIPARPFVMGPPATDLPVTYGSQTVGELGQCRPKSVAKPRDR